MAWQFLLQQWLRSQAEARLKEHLAEAVRSAATGGTEPEPESKPFHASIGFVFALEIEAGGLVDLMSTLRVIQGKGFVARQGVLRKRGIVVVESGMGGEAAEHATRALVEGHRPDWVISAGFSGALHPDLKRGDIVIAQGVANTQGQRLAIDFKADPAWLARTPGCRVGRLLTTDQIIASPDDKRRLGAEHDALCVDMESWHVAEACRQARQRFLAVRVISDAIDDAIPKDIANLATQKTVAGKVGSVVGTLWRRPGSYKDMLQLKESALECTDRLAKFLADLIPPLSG